MTATEIAAHARRFVVIGLTWRVFLGTAAIVSAVLGAMLFVASLSARRAAEQEMGRGLEQAADLVAQFLAGRERSLGGGARVFVQGPYFRALVAERRRDDILDQTFEAAEQLDADWVFITDERGVLLAKSDEPAASGDAMNGIPLVAGALQGRTTSGFGKSRDSLLFQAVAVPIVVPGGAPVGVLVATKLVDSLIAIDVQSATNGDVVFYALDDRGRPRVAASTLGRGAEVSAALTSVIGRGGSAPSRIRSVIAGTAYAAQGTAVTTAGGEVIGGFVVLRSRDAEPAGIAGARRSLLAAGALGLALALVAAYGAARHVTRPVRALADAARRAADGDYSADSALPAGIGSSSRDEISGLAAAFGALLAELRDKQALVDLLRVGGARRPRQPEPEPVRGMPGTIGVVRGRAQPRSNVLAIAKPEPQLIEATAPPARLGVALSPGGLLARRYAIEALIGMGGIGIVYRAVDLSLNEVVALKVLRPETIAADPGAVDRLKEEIRLARKVSHRNVVRTHDLGESDGVPFITMEYVEGSSLEALISERGALPASAVISIAKQICRALMVAHEQGVIHGDLKPANLLVGPDGLLKVGDFGVARLVHSQGAESRRAVPMIPGAVLGTPEYMAPEQLLGRAPDARSDIYSAGMVLHECVTGATPFGADTPLGFIARKLETRETGDARPAGLREGFKSAPKLTGAPLAMLIARMTAHDRDARPSSAAEVYEILEVITAN